MTHLTDTEIVDFLEDALPPARVAHLEACPPCRQKANDARTAMARAIEADIPEPSPLFWERFSERLHDEIRGAATTTPAGWRRWADHAGFRWALSGAIVVALLVGAAWRVTAPTLRHNVAPAQTPGPTPAGSGQVRANDDAAIDDGLNPDADPAWAVVRTLADEVTWSDAVEVGLAARPDAAERAARTLTSDERSELLRLLEAETRRPGA
jgi:hypothetical protein